MSHRRGKNTHSKKKKTHSKRDRRANPALVVHKGPFLMPSRYRVELRYSAKFILVDSSSTDANVRFRPSSIYDVDPAVGGGSYYGFTEIAAFFNKYRVHASRITLMFANRDAEAHVPYVLPVPVDPSTNVADPARYYMNNLARKKVVGNYAGMATGRITHFTTTRSVSGVQEFAEDPYTADVGANPTDNWFWFIGTRFLGSGSMTYGLSMDVEILTQVDFFDRKVLSDPAYLSPKVPREATGGPTFPPPQAVYIVQPPDGQRVKM